MNKLETKIQARNAVHQLARNHVAFIRERLSEFAGQKIILASGGFSHKFAKAVAALGLPSGTLASCYISSGHGYSVTANFRVAVTTEAGTFYGEVTVYLFDLNNGVLVKNENYVTHVDSLRTDYSAAAIKAAREEVKAARSALQAAESKLCYFGEHDC